MHIHNEKEKVKLHSFKEKFDGAFNDALKHLHSHSSLMLDVPHLGEVLEYAQKFAQSGKRIRPYMGHLAYSLCGGRHGAHEALVSLELFHLFAIVQDDVMDNASLRHHLPTIHEYAGSLLKNSSAGKSLAILLGDLLFNESIAILTREAPAVCPLFLEMAEGVICGQMLDVYSTSEKCSTYRTILRKMELKTAHYTFTYPLKIGGAIAGKMGHYDSFFEEFGRSLGIAFQIQDDLIDIFGKGGEEVMRDLEEGEHTLFTQFIFDYGTPEQKKKLSSLFGKKLSLEEKKEARKLFEVSGAIAQGKQVMALYFSKARHAIENEYISQGRKEEWLRLVEYIEKRNR